MVTRWSISWLLAVAEPILRKKPEAVAPEKGSGSVLGMTHI